MKPSAAAKMAAVFTMQTDRLAYHHTEHNVTFCHVFIITKIDKYLSLFRV